jgi:hypothetical protein
VGLAKKLVVTRARRERSKSRKSEAIVAATVSPPARAGRFR